MLDQRHRSRPRLGAAAIPVVLATAALVTMLGVDAARPTTGRPWAELPFPCAERWVASTYSGHGTHAVDWNLPGGQNDRGRPVLAGAPGVAHPHRDTGFGLHVMVDHGGGWTTLYAHLGSVAVAPGEVVDATTVVGRVGSSGRSDGSHLHHEQRYRGQAQPIMAGGDRISPSASSRGVSYVSSNCTVAAPVATVVSVTAFGDAERRRPAGLDALIPGRRAWAVVTIRNDGRSAWKRDGATEVALRGHGRSALATQGWDGVTPVAMEEDVVRPGAVATFVLPLRAPEAEIDFDEPLSVVGADGTAGAGGAGALRGHVRHRREWRVVSSRAYLDPAHARPTDLRNLAPGQAAWVVLRAENLGTSVWHRQGADAVALATDDPPDHRSRFANISWQSPSRPTVVRERAIAPGEVGTFEFMITMPPSGRAAEDQFNLVQGPRWMRSIGYRIGASVGYQGLQ